MTGLALAVTSSTGVMQIGIGTADDVIAVAETTADRRHAEEITPMLRSVLAAASTEVGALERIVVDIGPGRFTGLRVGLATVRALSFATGVPLVGVTSLEALAAGATPALGQPVTAVIDARREEVFQQAFLDGAPRSEAAVGKAEALASMAEGIVVGDGLDRYNETYEKAAAASDLTLRTGSNPGVSALLRLGFARTARPGSAVTPLYLRDPDVNPNVKIRPHG